MKKRRSAKLILNPKVGTALFVLCWTAYFLTYFGRLNYNALMAQIIAEGILSKTQAGMLGTVFFMTYAIGQLFSGWMGDRVSPRLFILTGLVASGVCNLIMCSVSRYPVMVVVWSINGFVQSFVWPPLLRIFCEHYTDVVRIRACVAINTTVPAGTLVTYGFAAWMAARGTWKFSFMAAGIVLCLFSVLWYLGTARIERWTEENGQDISFQKEENPAASPIGWKQFIAFGMLFLCVALAIQGMLKDSVTSWALVYLGEAHGLSTAMAILSTTVIPLLNLFGMYLASWMMKKRPSEFMNAIVLYLACGIALCFLLFGNLLGAAPALIILAAATTAMIGVNTLLISVFPGRFSATGQVATISGVLNFSVYVGSALSNYGIGAVVDRFGWNAAILLWIVSAALAAYLCAASQRCWRWHKLERMESC